MSESIFGTTTTINQWNADKTISSEEILKQIDEARVSLEIHSQKMIESAQDIFKELFGADLARGDLVIFPKHRLSTYNLFIGKLPQQITKQIKLDGSGTIQESIVLNGNHIPNFDVCYRSLFNETNL